MSKKTLITAAVGSAFVAGLAAAPVAFAGDNPFALSGLASGYQVADSQSAKPMEGKCGGGMRSAEGKCGMSLADADKDGKISKEEFAKHHDAMFAKMDANKDGFVDQTEMGKMMDGKYGEGMCGGAKGGAMQGKCGAMK